MFEVARDALTSGNLIEGGAAHTRQISADIEAPLKIRPECQAKD